MSINTDGTPDTVASFIRNFYRLSDDESQHQEYVDQFEYSSGTFFQIGPMVPAATSQEVLNWRHKAWEPVASRKHTVFDVYSKGKGDQAGTEFMLHGRVDYAKKDGQKAGATWAGRMIFDTGSVAKGAPKMTYYRVWITPDA